jgi:hypothetical protein
MENPSANPVAKAIAICLAALESVGIELELKLRSDHNE